MQASCTYCCSAVHKPLLCPATVAIPCTSTHPLASKPTRQVLNTFSTNSMICAGGNWPVGDKGFCPGDSGGPLIVKGASWAQDVQIGSVSFTSSSCMGAGEAGRVPLVASPVVEEAAALALLADDNSCAGAVLQQTGSLCNARRFAPAQAS